MLAELPVYKYSMSTKTKRQALFDELDKDNDTGVSTDVLVAIVEAEQAGVWEVLTDEYLANLKKQVLEARKNRLH